MQKAIDSIFKLNPNFIDLEILGGLVEWLKHLKVIILADQRPILLLPNREPLFLLPFYNWNTM